jgi:orotate phosphoribosyltransferase
MSIPTYANPKQELLELLRAKSVFHGDFVLASGARSKYYVDCRLTSLDPKGAWLIGHVLHDSIAAEAAKRSLRVDAVGGLTMGADPVSLAISIRSFLVNEKEPIQCFVVRKTPKSHGQTKLIEGNFKKGDQVVVIDDVVTKGDSTLAAIDAIEREGGKVLFAAVLVDRQEGGRAKIEQRGIPLVAAFTKEELLGPAS